MSDLSASTNNQPEASEHLSEGGVLERTLVTPALQAQTLLSFQHGDRYHEQMILAVHRIDLEL
jgi:hypothetical protein